MAAPTPDIAANTEKARLRRGPGGNVVVISARAVGEASAAPRPCSPREDEQHRLVLGDTAQR